MALSARLGRRGFLVLVALLFWVLIACLPTLHFLPGREEGRAGTTAREGPLSPGWPALFLPAAVSLAAGAVIVAAAKKARKKRRPEDSPYQLQREPIPTPWSVYPLLALFFILVSTAVWFALQSREAPWTPAPAGKAAVSAAARPVDSRSAPGETAEAEGNAPAAAWWAVVLAALAAAVAAAWGLSLRFRRLRAKPAAPGAEALRRAAEASGAKGGSDPPDVILRSYRDMCRMLARRVPYPQAMTARQFTCRCVQAGIAPREVARLTELFEKVRYGCHATTPEEGEECARILQTVAQLLGEEIG